MTSWENGTLRKWWADKMTSWENDKLIKWQVYNNDKLAKWQAHKMTICLNEELSKRWVV